MIGPLPHTILGKHTLSLAETILQNDPNLQLSLTNLHILCQCLSSRLLPGRHGNPKIIQTDHAGKSVCQWSGSAPARSYRDKIRWQLACTECAMKLIITLYKFTQDSHMHSHAGSKIKFNTYSGVWTEVTVTVELIIISACWNRKWI